MDTTIKPKVTVVMPVLNAASYLQKAIDSVLSQTFTDYEFLIIDDGSNDTSLQIIKSYADPRINLIRHETNKGLIYTLNEALEKAQGEFIARMDADDIWTSPKKLEKQLEYFNHSDDCVLVGTWATLIDSDDAQVGSVRHPYEDAAIRKSILIKNPFMHPSVMFRKDKAIQAGGFHVDDNHVEDYGLWIRLGKLGSFANIPEYLMAYRLHGASVSKQNKLEQIQNSFKLVKQYKDAYPNFELASWKWKTKLFLRKVSGL